MAAMEEPSTISEIMYQAIADRVFPGGAVAFGSCTTPYYYKAHGTYTFESSTPVTPESLWDMASLTKVMVTTPSIMILYDRGEIELEELACKYLPKFGNNGKEQVTIYQLLTHTAGLREFYPSFNMGLRDKTEVLDYIMNDKLWYPAGGIARYSDLSMIVLGLIVERISGVSLDVFVQERLFKPAMDEASTGICGRVIHALCESIYHGSKLESLSNLDQEYPILSREVSSFASWRCLMMSITSCSLWQTIPWLKLALPRSLLQSVKKDCCVVRYQRNHLPLIEGSGSDLQLHSVCTGTMFRPTELSDFDLMIVPTEVDRLHRNRLLWGEVHDPTAFLLGGVAGHAGLFSTIIDVCKFARMMLAGGMDVVTNRRLFRETTVQQFVTPGLQTDTNAHPFALGWALSLRKSVDGYRSAGNYLGPKTFGHTGLTGTSLWIDPDRDLFVALLTNAIHPTAVCGFGSKVREVRALIADAAVLTMEQQSTPERALCWQHDVYDGELTYQGLPQSPVGNYSTNNEDIGQNSSQSLRSSTQELEAEKQIVGQDLRVQYSETESYEEKSQDSTQNKVAFERSVVREGNLDICEESRQSSHARIVVPVFLIALFFSIIF